MRLSGRSLGVGAGRDARRTVLLVAGLLVVALTLGVANRAWAASSPSVATAGFETLTSTSARLNGSVNPEGSEVTDCHFEYGTYHYEYGSRRKPVSFEASVPCSALPGAGSSPVNVSAVPTGLTNGAEYAWRLVATNAIGTTVSGFEISPQQHLEVVKVTPSKGRTGGGKRVKVSGFGFSGVTAIHFGAISATRFELKCVSPHPYCVIVATSPPEHAGTVDVTVTTSTSQGTSAVTPNDRFTYK